DSYGELWRAWTQRRKQATGHQHDENRQPKRDATELRREHAQPSTGQHRRAFARDDVAGNIPLEFDGRPLRSCDVAQPLLEQRTPRMEAAGRWHVQQTGDIDVAQTDSFALPGEVWIWLRDGAQQRTRVWMLRRVDDQRGRSVFHNSAQVHHGDMTAPGEVLG